MAYAGQNFIQRLPYLIMPATVLGFFPGLQGVMRYGRSSIAGFHGTGLYENGQEQGTAGWRVNLLHGLRAP